MKRFNQVEWIGFILLTGLALYLTYLLRKGGIVSFIHPKRVPLMWATVIGLLTLVVYQSTKIFTIPGRTTKLNNYMPLGFILVCGALTLSAQEADRFSPNQSQKNITITSTSEKGYEITDSTEGFSVDRTLNKDVLGLNGERDPAQQDFREERQQPPQVNDDTLPLPDEIILNNENYTKTLSDIEVNPERYRGKKMIVEGFVYNNPQFAEDEFVIARMYMICCAADSQIIGLLCRGAQSEALTSEQWVRVEGVLAIESYEIDGQESIMPIIIISEVKLMETPENQYVYY